MNTTTLPGLPEELRSYLLLAWPSQFMFRDPKLGKGSVTPEDLDHFSRRVTNLVNRGVKFEQIRTALIEFRNAPGGAKLDRGGIIQRLWDQLAPRPGRTTSDDEEAQETPETLSETLKRLGSRFGVFEAIREAHGDPEEAVTLCPWLGQTNPDGVRWIDTTIYRDACARTRPGQDAESGTPIDVKRISKAYREVLEKYPNAGFEARRRRLRARLDPSSGNQA